MEVIGGERKVGVSWAALTRLFLGLSETLLASDGRASPSGLRSSGELSMSVRLVIRGEGALMFV